MKKVTGLNAFVLILNFAMVGLHWNERLSILEGQREVVEMWEDVHDARLKTFTDNWPTLAPDEYEKAMEKSRQYADDDKKLKQYWDDKYLEWTEKSAAIDLAAAKDINIGLSGQDCITKYGQPKYITAYDYYNLYEFHIDGGLIIKIYIEIHTKKSFYITYIDKKKPTVTLPFGDKYGHTHYIRNGLHCLSIWINSKLGLIVLDQANQ